MENKKEEFAKLIPYKTLAEVQSAGSAGHPLIMENSIHTPLFQSEEFIRIITEEILRHSDNVKGFEKPAIWMPLLNPFSTVRFVLDCCLMKIRYWLSFDIHFVCIGKPNVDSQTISSSEEHFSSIPKTN